MVAFTVNGLRREVDINANTSLLWVLRDHLKDRKSTRLNSSHLRRSRMPSSA